MLAAVAVVIWCLLIAWLIKWRSAPPPPSSALRIASCSGVMEMSPGAGSSSGAEDAGASTTQPSPPGSPPAPAQITSPAAVSSSRAAGW